MKKIGAQIEEESINKVREKEMVCPMLARAWQSRYWDTREGSPTLIVVGAILTD